MVAGIKNAWELSETPAEHTAGHSRHPTNPGKAQTVRPHSLCSRLHRAPYPAVPAVPAVPGFDARPAPGGHSGPTAMPT